MVDVLFKTWKGEDIKVETEIKNLMENLILIVPFWSILKRSTIDVTEEKILFHIPTKRIRCDMTFFIYLKESYDHTAIKLLNGNVRIEQFERWRYLRKCTNGDMCFEKVKADDWNRKA